MKDLISIIVPVYNVEMYLKECIESIINQSYKFLEIILINDESTDKSGEICDEYQKRDKRIRVIHKKNEGVSKARNTGLDIAKGKYIAFVDSDDYIEKEMMETLINNIKKSKSNISICGYRIFNKKNNIVRKSDDKLVEEILSSKEALKIIFENNKINGFLWNKLFERELIEKIRLQEDIFICEDLFMVCEILKKDLKIFYTSVPLYNYRNSIDSVTLNINKIFEESGQCKYMITYQKILNMFEDNSEVYKIIKARQIKTLLESYYLYYTKRKQCNKNITISSLEILKRSYRWYLLDKNITVRNKLIFVYISILINLDKIKRN